MSMKRSTIGALALAAATTVATPSMAQTAKVGELRCATNGRLGLIVTSSESMRCVFRPVRGPREVYAGNIRKFGLDIGATSGGTIVWAVFAPTGGVPRGALAGSYVGGSAQASAVVGLGANALVGGNSNTIGLQPFSVQGQRGLNIAAGVADLSLTPSR